MTSAQIINLGRRFGIVGDITKARKKRGPDSGLDWKGYNAANPTETQKDSRGRWTDNPVGRAIAQAFSNIRDRQPSRPGDWVGLADLRAEMGGQFPRDAVDAELHRLRRGSDDEPRVRIIPVANAKALKPRDHAAALQIGDSPAHAISFGDFEDLLPPPQRSDTISGMAQDLAPSPFSPDAEPWRKYRADLNRQMAESVAGLGEWDDSELTVARDAARRLADAADAELKKRKAAPKTPAKPRPTARLTAKPEPDYEHMAVTMRGLPVLPESEGAARQALEPLTIPQLKELARTSAVPVNSKARKQDIRDAIVNQLVGSRLTTDAVMNYDDKDRFDRRRAEAARAPESAGLTGSPSWIKPSTEPMERRRSMADSLRGTPAAKVTAKPRTSKPGTSRPGANTALLGSLTKPRLQEVAARVGVPSTGKTKPQLVESITAATAGAPGTLRRALGEFDVAGDGGTFGGRHGATRREAASEGNDLATMHNVLERMRHDELKQKIMALEGAGTEGIAQAEAMLSRMTLPQLREFAATLGPTAKLPAKIAKGEAVRRIVDGTIGYRQRSRATGGGRTQAENFGRGGAGGDPAASLRHQEAQLDEMRADLVSQYGEDPDGWPEARGDRQVEEYYDQLDRVQRMRRAGKA